MRIHRLLSSGSAKNTARSSWLFAKHSRYVNNIALLLLPLTLLALQTARSLPIWFWQDDFAWLQLPARLEMGTHLTELLFCPMAQGTVRPLSERIPFLVLPKLFGPVTEPFRILAAACLGIAVLYVMRLLRQLGSSSIAVTAASIGWLLHGAVAVVLSWTSALNQAMLAACQAALAYYWLQYGLRGSRRALLVASGIFLAGFAIHEASVANAWLLLWIALLFFPAGLKVGLWYLGATLLYVLARLWLTPLPSQGPYAVASLPLLLRAFIDYWWAHLTAEALPKTQWNVLMVGAVVIVLLAVGLKQLPARLDRQIALCGLGWFCITLAPYLFFAHHITFYYLTVPALGFCMVAAAFANGRLKSKKVVVLVLGAAFLAYIGTHTWRQHKTFEWYRDWSLQARTLWETISHSQHLSPRVFVLHKIAPELFWGAVYHGLFRLGQPVEVFVSPETIPELYTRQNLVTFGATTRDFEISHRQIAVGLAEGGLDVFIMHLGKVYNASKLYGLFVLGTLMDNGHFASPEVDLVSQKYDSQLLDGWHQPELTHRWTAPSASLLMPTCCSTEGRLCLEGFLPQNQLKNGPVKVTIHVEALNLPVRTILTAAGPFQRCLDLPDMGLDKLDSMVKISIGVSPVYLPGGDSRRLGLALKRIEMR